MKTFFIMNDVRTHQLHIMLDLNLFIIYCIRNCILCFDACTTYASDVCAGSVILAALCPIANQDEIRGSEGSGSLAAT